jgi:membrane protease YdiL (CAAX protease family)
MRAFVARHPLASFVTLAYAISWAVWIPLVLRGALVVPGGAITHFPGLLGPAAAAFIVVGLQEGSSGIGHLLRRMVSVSRPPSRFLLLSLSPLAFLALALVATELARRAVPTAPEFALYSGLPRLPLPAVIGLVFLFNGYGEEIGWRGFALERLQHRFGAVRGTLALALIWAGWHVPAFWFVEGYRNLGVATLLGGFGLGIIAGSLVLARVVGQTGGSILAAALWHAAYNMTSATAASQGSIGMVTTSCVMAWASVLLWQEWRRPLSRSRMAVTAP